MPTNILAVKFPLEIDDETGSFLAYNMSEIQPVVEQNIKMVLLTNPEERLFNNDFGVGLQRYLFLQEAQIANGIPGDNRFPPLKQYIVSQLEKYVPYISTEDMQISLSQNTLNIKFKYYINNSVTASEFDLTIDDIS